MLSDFLSKRTAAGHPPDMLAEPDLSRDRSVVYPTCTTASSVLATRLSRLLFGNSARLQDIEALANGNVRTLDISSAKAKARALFDGIRESVDLDIGMESLAIEKIPTDICMDIYRNIMAFNYACTNTSITFDDAGILASPMLTSMLCDKNNPPFTDRYIISVCIALNRTLMSISMDRDYGEPYMQLVLPLMAKPVSNWMEIDFNAMLMDYASSEMLLQRSIHMLSDTRHFSDALFDENGDRSHGMYYKLVFGGNALHLALSRFSDLARDHLGVMSNKLFSNASLLRAILRIVISRSLASEINASVNAVDIGDAATTEITVPHSYLYDDVYNADCSVHGFQSVRSVYTHTYFIQYAQYIDRKYMNTGFPKQIQSFHVIGSGTASVPVLCGYDSEVMLGVTLIPSTEHASAMLRAMYGMKKSTGLEVHNPSQEILLGYAYQGFAGRMVAKAAGLGVSLAYLGLKDIRPFIVPDAEPRPAGDCPPDELFHVFV